MKKKFYPQRSLSVLLFILILPVAIIAYHKWNYQSVMALSIIILIITLVNLYLYFLTYFIIEKDRLIIKIGFFTYKKIYLKDIIAVKKDKTLRRSLAASVKNRIEIFYPSSSVIISPKNIEEFLKVLNKEITN